MTTKLRAASFQNSLIDSAMIPTNAITSTKIASSVNLGRRNMIINGAMQVAQRSTSAVTISGDGVYTTVDRFKARTYGGSGRFSMQQVTDTPNKSFANSLKLLVTTTETSGTYGYSIATILETSSVIGANFGHSDAKPTTISFHVKSSITGTYNVSLRIDSGSGEPSNVGEYTINSANTWEKKTITFPAYTGGESLSNLIIDFGLGKQTSKTTSSALTWQTTNYVYTSNQVDWQSNNGATFYITGVQYEVDSQATLFEHRSFAEELPLCQRYFQKISSMDCSAAYVSGQSAPTFNFTYPTSMRAAPTITLTSPAGGVASSAVYNQRNITKDSYNFYLTGSNNTHVAIGHNGQPASITLEAEL